MSKTISFVASDELAEYLEAEAERRMTTISTTAQMLLAETVRREQQRAAEAGQKPASGGSGEVPEGKTVVDPDKRIEAIEKGIEEFEQEHGEIEDKPAKQEDVFDRHPNAWYQPNSDKHDYAVELPEHADVYDAGKRRYYKTRRGAAEALTRWYE